MPVEYSQCKATILFIIDHVAKKSREGTNTLVVHLKSEVIALVVCLYNSAFDQDCVETWNEIKLIPTFCY